MKRNNAYLVGEFVGLIATAMVCKAIEDKADRDRINKRTPKRYRGIKIKTIPRWGYHYA